MTAYLAIETSHPRGSLALFDAAGSIDEALFPEGLVHAREIAPQISALLERSGESPADLGGVLVSVGPGSYTGCRIGVTTAKTLGLALRVPVLGVSSLEILAAALIDDESAEGEERSARVVAVRDGRRGTFYVAEFEISRESRVGYGATARFGGEPRRLGPDQVVRAADAGTLLAGDVRVIGDGADALLAATGAVARRPSRSFDVPRAAILARMARRRLLEARYDAEAVHRLAPAYLRPSRPELVRSGEESASSAAPPTGAAP